MNNIIPFDGLESYNILERKETIKIIFLTEVGYFHRCGYRWQNKLLEDVRDCHLKNSRFIEHGRVNNQ